MAYEGKLKDLYSKLQTTHNFILGPVDTDSISICHPDGRPISEEEQNALIAEINSMLPERIRFAHDGYYEACLAVRTKNYALLQNEKIKIKGSALKASLKEKALREFIDTFISALLNGSDTDSLIQLYESYAREIIELKDITRWSFKKTVTEKILNPARTNEQKVLDAFGDGEVQVGNKHYLYFDVNDNLKLQEHWNGDHNVDRLLEKLFKTVKVFETVVNVKMFHNFKLKKNKPLLQQLLTRIA